MGKEHDLKQRTKDLALRVIRLYTALPKSTQAQVMGKQVLRSGTSVGANYREATRARSPAEFISKMEIGLQELEESSYWFELLVESGVVPQTRLAELRKEAEELAAIFVASIKTAKSNRRKQNAKCRITSQFCILHSSFCIRHDHPLARHAPGGRARSNRITAGVPIQILEDTLCNWQKSER